MSEPQKQVASQSERLSSIAAMLAGRLALEHSLGIDFIATAMLTAQIAPHASATDDSRARDGAWARLREEVTHCRLCRLSEHRRQAVMGEGGERAELFCLGEIPDIDEDAEGRPFMGDAGQLLTAMIEKGLKKTRASVYITYAIKCRHIGDRKIAPDDLSACLPYLQREIALVKPKAILCLGQMAAQALLAVADDLAALRSRWHDYNGIPVRVTHNPAYLVQERQKQGKKTAADRETYDDLKAVAACLGWKI